MKLKYVVPVILVFILLQACQRDHEVYDRILNESGQTISIRQNGFSSASRIDGEVKDGESRTMRLQYISSDEEPKGCPYDREFLAEYDIITEDTTIAFASIMDSLEWRMDEAEDLRRVGKAKAYVCTCVFK